MPPKNIPYVMRTAVTSRCCWGTARETSNMGKDQWRRRSSSVIQPPFRCEASGLCSERETSGVVCRSHRSRAHASGQRSPGSLIAPATAAVRATVIMPMKVAVIMASPFQSVARAHQSPAIHRAFHFVYGPLTLTIGPRTEEGIKRKIGTLAFQIGLQRQFGPPHRVR